MMDGEKFAKWFRRVTKIALIPAMFVIAASEGAAYPIAGIMTVALLFVFIIEHEGLGD
jgi:hypothetical protein